MSLCLNLVSAGIGVGVVSNSAHGPNLTVAAQSGCAGQELRLVGEFDPPWSSHTAASLSEMDWEVRELIDYRVAMHQSTGAGRLESVRNLGGSLFVSMGAEVRRVEYRYINEAEAYRRDWYWVPSAYAASGVRVSALRLTEVRAFGGVAMGYGGVPYSGGYLAELERYWGLTGVSFTIEVLFRPWSPDGAP